MLHRMDDNFPSPESKVPSNKMVAENQCTFSISWQAADCCCNLQNTDVSQPAISRYNPSKQPGCEQCHFIKRFPWHHGHHIAFNESDFQHKRRSRWPQKPAAAGKTKPSNSSLVSKSAKRAAKQKMILKEGSPSENTGHLGNSTRLGLDGSVSKTYMVCLASWSKQGISRGKVTTSWSWKKPAIQISLIWLRLSTSEIQCFCLQLWSIWDTTFGRLRQPWRRVQWIRYCHCLQRGPQRPPAHSWGAPN